MPAAHRAFAATFIQLYNEQFEGPFTHWALCTQLLEQFFNTMSIGRHDLRERSPLPLFACMRSAQGARLAKRVEPRLNTPVGDC
jgi:hypothetical protein